MNHRPPERSPVPGRPEEWGSTSSTRPGRPRGSRCRSRPGYLRATVWGRELLVRKGIRSVQELARWECGYGLRHRPGPPRPGITATGELLRSGQDRADLHPHLTRQRYSPPRDRHRPGDSRRAAEHLLREWTSLRAGAVTVGEEFFLKVRITSCGWQRGADLAIATDVAHRSILTTGAAVGSPTPNVPCNAGPARRLPTCARQASPCRLITQGLSGGSSPDKPVVHARCYARRRATSYSTMPAATPAFSDSAPPGIEIRTR